MHHQTKVLPIGKSLHWLIDEILISSMQKGNVLYIFIINVVLPITSSFY
jgi:hypothetical protein